MQYASSRRLFVELLTHGFWEDQKKIEMLVAARPARVTISLDGVGAIHNTVRGREGFFDKTAKTIETLLRMQELRQLKLGGFPIVNSQRQLDAMIPYFQDPATHRVSVQAHQAHEKKLSCSALTTLQVQANGDVTICAAMPSIGNFKDSPIREIWNHRPRWWESGCCLERRL